MKNEINVSFSNQNDRNDQNYSPRRANSMLRTAVVLVEPCVIRNDACTYTVIKSIYLVGRWHFKVSVTLLLLKCQH